MSKKYTFYPGCSSKSSSAHLEKSLRAVAPKVGIELEEIDDWNCCGTSVGHITAGHLPNAVLSGRNLALAQKQESTDVLTACAACYIHTHDANEQIRENEKFKANVNEALGAAGMSYDGSLHVRHVCEVLVNDVGMDAVKEQVTNPLEGLKVAGWVGCQTLRPFAHTERGGAYDTYDQPEFLDAFIEACGAEAVPFENKTSCCGGSIAVISPDKSLGLMKKILDEAKEQGADCVTTPCPLCQQNLEMYQPLINETFGTDFKIPVVFYSQLMAVAFGMSAKDAALDQHLIPPAKLAGMAK